jgi:hypothetical protein
MHFDIEAFAIKIPPSDIFHLSINILHRLTPRYPPPKRHRDNPYLRNNSLIWLASAMTYIALEAHTMWTATSPSSFMILHKHPWQRLQGRNIFMTMSLFDHARRTKGFPQSPGSHTRGNNWGHNNKYREEKMTLCLTIVVGIADLGFLPSALIAHSRDQEGDPEL